MSEAKTKGARILVVEDDEDNNRLLCTILEQAGYAARPAYSGTEALLLLNEHFDLILLDLMLPGLNGEGLLARLRAERTTPVIAISGKADLDSRVAVLALGADDFIAKPFAGAEVLARVAALLRRARDYGGEGEGAARDLLERGELKLDARGFTVRWADEPIELTQTEFALLRELMKRPGEVFSRDRLYREVWDEDFVGDDNAITVHISHLRRKLRRASGAELIATVWGIGYKLL